MEQSTTYTLTIPKLKTYVPETQWIGAGDNFCMFKIRSIGHLHSLGYPCRFEGLMMLYCVKGQMKISINLNELELEDNHLVVVSPEKIIKVTEMPEHAEGELDFVVVAMSGEFTSGMHIDFRRLLTEGVALSETPDMILTESQKRLMDRYLGLMEDILWESPVYKEDILTSIMSSMVNYVAGIWSVKLDELKMRAQQSSNRSQMVFEQFIRLVGEYHTKHRNVGFYADKLCLTPKYLSKLIKTATGKSAPEWIDGFVILEAKNLLKYSDISIKEIVYRLNFPNQSVFYKFFKCRTGMTPSEYRNS